MLTDIDWATVTTTAAELASEYVKTNGLEFSAIGVIAFVALQIVRRVKRAQVPKDKP